MSPILPGNKPLPKSECGPLYTAPALADPLNAIKKKLISGNKKKFQIWIPAYMKYELIYDQIGVLCLWAKCSFFINDASLI